MLRQKLKHLHFNIKVFKELKDLYDMYGFFAWSRNWPSVNKCSEHIKELQADYPIENFFASLFFYC